MTSCAIRAVPTPWGAVALAFDSQGVLALELPHSHREDALAALRARGFCPTGTGRGAAPSWLAVAEATLATYFRAPEADLTKIPLSAAAPTPFAAEVRARLRQVRAGATTTYGALAAAAGSPGAARAVGRLMATNPVPLLVPCHRVLPQSGALGGFSAEGGSATKARLLAHERARPAKDAGLFQGSDGGGATGDAATRHLAAVDRRLGRAMATIGPCRLTVDGSSSPFAALAEAIVYQQLATRAAATIATRLRAAVTRLTPQRVLATPEEALRGAGLSQAKLRAIRELAARAAQKDLPSRAALERMSDEEVIGALTESRGIGRWTAEMFLLFRLGRPDVLSSGDLGLRKGFGVLLGRPAGALPDAAEMMRYGERWRPYRSVASWYLWRLAERGS